MLGVSPLHKDMHEPLPITTLLNAALLILIIGCSGSKPTPRLDSLDALVTKLDALVPGLLEERGVPGAAISLIQNGKSVWSNGYGLADKNTKRPVTINTHFNIGSISKTFTAWAVMTLAEKGLIDLDTPVARYLKRWRLPKSDFDNNKVTVRRLLSHTAGLSVYPASASINGYLPGEKMPALEEALSRSYGSFGQLRVIREPGTSFEYTNGSYVILQLLIEDVTGQSFADYMQDNVFTPLGLTKTEYEWTPELEASVATPYNQNGEPWPHFQGVEQASGGVYTTAGDLARFVAAIDSSEGNLSGGGVLKPETVLNMIVPAGESDGQYGLGYQMTPLKKDGYFVAHQGANEGFRALFLFDIENRAGIVILTNSDAGGRIMGEIVCAWAKWAAIELSEPCPNSTG